MNKLKAFHGEVAIKEKYVARVKAHAVADEIIKEALDKDLIYVDFEKGLVYSRRFANKEMGTSNLKGYRVATLHLGGRRVQIKLHRAVWIAKNGFLPRGLVIDHINGIKSDNRLVNLRLADAKLNSANRRSYNGENNPAVKINSYIAACIRNNFKKESYSELAVRFTVSKSLVASIIKGKIWKLNI